MFRPIGRITDTAGILFTVLPSSDRNPNMSDTNHPESQPAAEPTESFDQLLSQYEQSHARLREDGGKQLEGTVIAVTADSVLLDIGFKSEGILPLAEFQSKGEDVKPGDKLLVSVKGRDPDGYYELSRTKISRPKDWSALEQAFTEKATIVGTVTGVVKGGVSVDVGVRAFMPASRSGTRDAAELEKMVGQEIRCRITKLDVTEEDVVVDRRALAEEEERAGKERRYAEVKEGDTVQGTVRSLTDYGAFVDLGGVDGLLHISDIAWSRINKPEDVLGGRSGNRSQGIESRYREAAHFPRHEATAAAPLGFRARKIQDRRSRARSGVPHRGFRRLCRTGAGRRRPGAHLRNVMGQEGEDAQRSGQARRSR